MDLYKHQVFQPRSAGRARLGALLCRLSLACGAALAMLVLGGMAARQAQAEAGPQISIVSPVYSVQGKNMAEGPVGANVAIKGSGWTPGSGPVSLWLVDAQYDASAGGQPGAACISSSAPRVTIPGHEQIPVDNDGNFNVVFQWPAGANAVGHSYWICGAQGALTFPGTDSYAVLADSPPALSISVTQATPGETITVTGKNWLPGNQKIQLVIAPCVACEPPYSQTATVTAKADGSLSASIQVPGEAKPGDTLYISGQNVGGSADGALTVSDPAVAPHLTVAQPAPTPSLTPTPPATHTPAPTPVTGGNNGSNNSSNGLLIVLLSALGVVLVLAAVVAVLLFIRSRNPVPVPGGSPYSGPEGGYGHYGGPRRTGSGPDPSYASADTSTGYYDAPPLRSGGRSGPPAGQYGGWGGQGWQEGSQEPGPDDDEFGDQPTISSNTPWR